MAKLIIPAIGRTIEIDPGNGPFVGRGRTSSLLDVAWAYGIEIPSHCGGVCLCTTCHVQVVSGAHCLSEPSAKERRFLERLAGSCDCRRARLACQAVLLSDDARVEIEVPTHRV